MLREIAKSADGLTRDQAAAMAGISVTSSAVGATVAKLVDLGLIKLGQHKRYRLSEDMRL